MKNMFFVAIAMLSAFLVSCVSMPGDVSYTESKTDGTKQISVDPGWLKDAYIRLGVYKTSKMDKDSAVIIVYSDNTIGFDDSLFINVDGEKTAFKSLDKISLLETDATNKRWFKKRYDVKLKLLQKMISGKNVWVKLSSQNGNYVEGEFSDGPTTARRGFAKFLAQIDFATGEILAHPKQK